MSNREAKDDFYRDLRKAFIARGAEATEEYDYDTWDEVFEEAYFKSCQGVSLERIADELWLGMIEEGPTR